MEKIITKQELVKRLNEDKIHTIGRALTDLLKHKKYKDVHQRIVTLGARYYEHTHTLLDWQMAPWLADVGGYPRLCMYSKQLNDIENENSKPEDKVCGTPK